MRIDCAEPTRRAEGQSPIGPINLTMNSTHLRRIIDDAVSDLGHKNMHCTESVLIQEGYVFGRQFRYEGVRAIWFAEEGVVKLHGDNGRLLRNLTVADQDHCRKTESNQR